MKKKEGLQLTQVRRGFELPVTQVSFSFPPKGTLGKIKALGKQELCQVLEIKHLANNAPTLTKYNTLGK